VFGKKFERIIQIFIQYCKQKCRHKSDEKESALLDCSSVKALHLHRKHKKVSLSLLSNNNTLFMFRGHSNSTLQFFGTFLTL